MLILLKRLGIDIFSETSHSALWCNEILFPISLSIIKKVMDKLDSLKLGNSKKHLFPSIMQKLKGISHSRIWSSNSAELKYSNIDIISLGESIIWSLLILSSKSYFSEMTLRARNQYVQTMEWKIS